MGPLDHNIHYFQVNFGYRYFDEPKKSRAPRQWPSPVYKRLIGNVLPEFLSFSQYPFPELPSANIGQPFPTLTETHEYLHPFARLYLSSGVIRLGTEVVRLEVVRGGQWKVVARDWVEGTEGRRSRIAGLLSWL